MQQKGTPRWIVVAAMAVGIAGGSYGIASAASGNGSASTTTTTAATAAAATAAAPAAAGPGAPWGHQRSDEMLLTGDAESKVEAVALAHVSGGTVVRVETDADGNAKYEAHMTDASGNPVTVYVDANFDFVSLDSR